ncbi:MAG: branched-chain amino acid permease, partial [Actinobacteria bacterium]
HSDTFVLWAGFPARFVARLKPALRAPTPRTLAVPGAGPRVATTPVLPAGLPVLLALTALAVLAWPARRKDRRRELSC